MIIDEMLAALDTFSAEELKLIIQQAQTLRRAKLRSMNKSYLQVLRQFFPDLEIVVTDIEVFGEQDVIDIRNKIPRVYVSDRQGVLDRMVVVTHSKIICLAKKYRHYYAAELSPQELPLTGFAAGSWRRISNAFHGRKRIEFDGVELEAVIKSLADYCK